MTNIPTTKTGVGVMIIRDNRYILLGRRRGSHGAGEYAGAGGHIEPGESFKQTALREVTEELGPDLRTTNLRFLCVSNLKRYLPKQYVDIGLVAKWQSGE